jgi:hypothetical protein
VEVGKKTVFAALPTLPIASANAVLITDVSNLLMRKVICPS